MRSWLMNRLEINFTFSVKLIPRARTSQLSQQAESKALTVFKPSYLQPTFCFPRTKNPLRSWICSSCCQFASLSVHPESGPRCISRLASDPGPLVSVSDYLDYRCAWWCLAVCWSPLVPSSVVFMVYAAFSWAKSQESGARMSSHECPTKQQSAFPSGELLSHCVWTPDAQLRKNGGGNTGRL